MLARDFWVDSASKFIEIAAKQRQDRMIFGVGVAFLVRRSVRPVVAQSSRASRRSFASCAATSAGFRVDFAPKFIEIAAKTRQISLDSGRRKRTRYYVVFLAVSKVQKCQKVVGLGVQGSQILGAKQFKVGASQLKAGPM